MANSTANQIHEAYAYLRIRDANAAIDFYKKAFGAEEVFRLAEPGGRIAHAELMFGPTKVMLSGEYPEHGIQSPQAFGGTGSSVHLHVENVDTMTKQAAEAALRTCRSRCTSARRGRTCVGISRGHPRVILRLRCGCSWLGRRWRT